ncbi:hypothetical protein F5882DRAFT_289501, partial [Hyaloscypha sp. PMI_1271]
SLRTRLLRPGGITLPDNILRCGLVADHSPTNPWTTKESELTALDEFNEAWVRSERIEKFLMPMFDGLGCGRLLD